MENEHFQRWDPCWWYRDVRSTVIASVKDDWEGFRLILTGSNCPDTRVSVPAGAVVLYRVYDESGLIGREIQGIAPNHCFYTIESSPLLAECWRMFSGIRDADTMRHYAIYTLGRCVDIVSTREPRFVLLRDFAAGRYDAERPEAED
jgi:hypothetical protein